MNKKEKNQVRDPEKIRTPALFTALIQDAKNMGPRENPYICTIYSGDTRCKEQGTQRESLHLHYLQWWYKMQRTWDPERIPTPALFTVVIHDWKNKGPRENPYTCTIYSGDTRCKEHGTQRESLHLHYLQWWYKMQRTWDPERIPTPALFTVVIQDAKNMGPRENPYTCTIYSGDTRCKEHGTQRESLHLHYLQWWYKMQRAWDPDKNPYTCTIHSSDTRCKEQGTQRKSLHLHYLQQFFFFCVQCDDRTKSSGRWLLGSPPSAVVRQLAPRAWCPLQCLLAKTVGVLSPGLGRSEECAQGFAPQSHIHSGLNQQDLVSSDVFLAHSDQ